MVKIREFIRLIAIGIRYFILTQLYGMDISRKARISFGAILDKTYPRGIHIKKESYVASGAIVFSHDFTRSYRADTVIGERCFIGVNAIIMPGIVIGDESIVGSGAVVTRDVPPHTIVAGNPAIIIKEGIRTKKYGQLVKI
jgi:acetyltransferase-like isoleucine patch superfamily enzyme